MIEDIVKNYLINSKNIAADKLEQPGLLISDLGLDSLDMVEMLFEVEDRCGFQLQEPLRYLSMSFTDMLSDIENQIRANNNGELPEFSVETQH